MQVPGNLEVSAECNASTLDTNVLRRIWSGAQRYEKNEITLTGALFESGKQVIDAFFGGAQQIWTTPCQSMTQQYFRPVDSRARTAQALKHHGQGDGPNYQTKSIRRLRVYWKGLRKLHSMSGQSGLSILV